MPPKSSLLEKNHEPLQTEVSTLVVHINGIADLNQKILQMGLYNYSIGLHCKQMPSAEVTV